ncbi:hypothetical protein RFI_20696, partial [Reticulomyxa filosa]
MLDIEENKNGLTNLLDSNWNRRRKIIDFGSHLLDFKNFEKLFNILGVIDHIHYGTFNKICERITNEGGDARKLVENLILPGNDNKKKTGRTVRSKILLIDEVDVFFTSSAAVWHDTITKLIDFIWENRGSSLKLKNVKQSNQYNASIKNMLISVQNFLSHGYQVSNDKIGYKEQYGISYNTRYGYNILFAYYHEHEQNKISA